MKNIGKILLILNGIYDICCSLAIINNYSFLSKIHVLMFNSLINQRILAYWIFTYGIVRLYCGLYNLAILSIITYLLEAFFFEYEYYVSKKLDRNKLNYVTFLCFLFITIIYYDK